MMRKLTITFSLGAFFSLYVGGFAHTFCGCCDFLRAWKRNCNAVGTPFRTGECTSKSLAKPLRQLQAEKEEVVALELGAGDGAQTIPLGQKLREKDVLLAVELDKKLAHNLSVKCEKKSNISVYGDNFLEWESPYESYDYIVSMIPFNSIPVHVVKKILKRCDELLEEDGFFAYVEYRFWGALKERNLRKEADNDESARRELDDFLEVKRILKDFKKNYDVKVETWTLQALIDLDYWPRWWRNFEIRHPWKTFKSLFNYNCEHPIHIYLCRKKKTTSSTPGEVEQAQDLSEVSTEALLDEVE